MELRQLEYFVAIARHRNVTRAAEELYVTQSALSQQLRRLEAELGLALLRRTARGVELTPPGADLLARAERILAEVARARAELDDHATLRRGAVRVAASTGDAVRLPALLAAFHRDHPGVRIALRQGSPRAVVELVRRGAVDLALACLRDEDIAGTQVDALAEEPLRLVLAADDPLAGGQVALSQLRDRPLILAEPGSALRANVIEACNAAGFSPVPLFELSDPASVRFLAHAGLGASVVPASWLEHPGPEVGVATLTEPAPRHRLSLLRPTTGGSPAAELLHARLRDELG